MNCSGCGKHVSEFTAYLHPEPDEFWHRRCWMRVFWHVENESGGNPRPMTNAEKSALADSIRPDHCLTHR